MTRHSEKLLPNAWKKLQAVNFEALHSQHWGWEACIIRLLKLPGASWVPSLSFPRTTQTHQWIKFISLYMTKTRITLGCVFVLTVSKYNCKCLKHNFLKVGNPALSIALPVNCCSLIKTPTKMPSSFICLLACWFTETVTYYSCT